MRRRAEMRVSRAPTDCARPLAAPRRSLWRRAALMSQVDEEVIAEAQEEGIMAMETEECQEKCEE